MRHNTHNQTLSEMKAICNRMDQIRKEIITLKDAEAAGDDFFLNDTCDSLFNAILDIANYCCGDVTWTEIRNFLKEAQVEISDDFDIRMTKMDL